jgi:hypothetical protein
MGKSCSTLEKIRQMRHKWESEKETEKVDDIQLCGRIILKLTLGRRDEIYWIHIDQKRAGNKTSGCMN